MKHEMLCRIRTWLDNLKTRAPNDERPPELTGIGKTLPKVKLQYAFYTAQVTGIVVSRYGHVGTHLSGLILVFEGNTL